MAQWAKALAAEPPDDRVQSQETMEGTSARAHPHTRHFLEKHFKGQSESTQQREQDKQELSDLKQKTIQQSCLLEAQLGE